MILFSFQKTNIFHSNRLQLKFLRKTRSKIKKM